MSEVMTCHERRSNLICRLLSDTGNCVDLTKPEVEEAISRGSGKRQYSCHETSSIWAVTSNSASISSIFVLNRVD